MLLLDHFHLPLSDRKPWEAVHATWVITIMQRLNAAVLPARYEAEPETHRGTAVQLDIATFEDGNPPQLFETNRANGVATAVATFAPPAPPITAVADFAEADLFEVRVYRDFDGLRLVAAVELVSEANKDRPSTRRAFARKCGSYLQKGVSVVVVDVVTNRSANLHAELVEGLHLPDVFDWASPTGLSAVCYRAVQGATQPGVPVGNGQVRLDVWPFPLAIGQELPTVPLWLAADLAVPLELELTYAAACKSLRLG